MTSLPSTYPHLTLHLTDRAHTPFISSPLSQPGQPQEALANELDQTSRQSQLQALQSLTTTALKAHNAAARFGLGLPNRIMVEHGSSGPVVLTSYVRAKRKEPGPPPPAPATAVVSEGKAQPASDPVPRAQAELATGALAPSSDPNQHGAKKQQETDRNAAAAATTPRSTESSAQSPSPAPAVAPTHSQPQPVLPSKQSAASAASPAPPSNPGAHQDKAEEAGKHEANKRKPLFVSLVISPSPDDLADARRAATCLERAGRELQHALAEEESECLAAPGPPGTEVGGDSAPATIGRSSPDNTAGEEDDETAAAHKHGQDNDGDCGEE